MVLVGRGLITAGSVAGLGVLAGLLLLAPEPRLGGPIVPMTAFAVSFLPIGCALIRRLGPTPVTVAVWLTGTAALAWLIARAASGWTVGAWATQWLGLLPWGLLVVVLLRFPDAPAAGWRRRLVPVTYAVLGLATTALALAALAAPLTLVTEAATDLPAWAALAVRVGAWAAFALVGLALVAVGLLVRAARRVEPAQRGAYAALIPAAVLFPAGVVFDVAGVDDATVVGIVAVPVGIGVAVLQAAWQDLDVMIDRRLVAGGVWVLVFAVLALALLGVEPVLDRLDSPLSALLLALLVVLLAALRRRLLDAAHRWLFGGTDDPFAVVRAVGEQMDASLDPAETLRRSPEAVARALRLPYAAIILRTGDVDTLFAEYGRRLVEPVSRPLIAGGLTLGRLEVSPRGHGQVLSTTEDRLVATVAVHASRVAEAYVLSLAVQGARERLVLAREEERLRLRNDLHDGLGPLLAGARMQLAAARHSADSQRRADLVNRAATDLGTATTSVRELVDGLRPAALDDGLVAALDGAVHALLPDRIVVIDVPGPLPALSAGVEIAAYRIVTEAATNIARHAPGATQGTIQLLAGQPADALVLDVADDGPGIANGSAGAGVGQASMRARAEELGGRLEVRTGPAGTSVRAVLPMTPAIDPSAASAAETPRPGEPCCP